MESDSFDHLYHLCHSVPCPHVPVPQRAKRIDQHQDIQSHNWVVVQNLERPSVLLYGKVLQAARHCNYNWIYLQHKQRFHSAYSSHADQPHRRGAADRDEADTKRIDPGSELDFLLS